MGGRVWKWSNFPAHEVTSMWSGGSGATTQATALSPLRCWGQDLDEKTDNLLVRLVNVKRLLIYHSFRTLLALQIGHRKWANRKWQPIWKGPLESGENTETWSSSKCLTHRQISLSLSAVDTMVTSYKRWFFMINILNLDVNLEIYLIGLKIVFFSKTLKYELKITYLLHILLDFKITHFTTIHGFVCATTFNWL